MLCPTTVGQEYTRTHIYIYQYHIMSPFKPSDFCSENFFLSPQTAVLFRWPVSSISPCICMFLFLLRFKLCVHVAERVGKQRGGRGVLITPVRIILLVTFSIWARPPAFQWLHYCRLPCIKIYIDSICVIQWTSCSRQCPRARLAAIYQWRAID